MDRRSWGTVATTILAFVALPASAQTLSVPDSELAQGTGHWVAYWVSFQVSFQSGEGPAPSFGVDVKRVGNQLQATLPPELALAAGTTYLLDRASAGVFRHTDAAGRVVEFSIRSSHGASLVVTGRGGDGRFTWQLTRG